MNGNVITFDDIFQLYKKHFRGKQLTLVCDCCYSGEWIRKCAQALDREGIPACGHEAKKKGILIKIHTACSKNEKAYDTVYSNGGVSLDADRNLVFHGNKELHDPKSTTKTQTTASADFTQVSCFKHPDMACNLTNPDITLRWTWQDVVRKSFRDEISDCECVESFDRLHCYHVSVKADKLEEFQVRRQNGPLSATDVRQYGHVLDVWRNDDRIRNREKLNCIRKYCPQTAFKGKD